jgi:hypothetical protein
VYWGTLEKAQRLAVSTHFGQSADEEEHARLQGLIDELMDIQHDPTTQPKRRARIQEFLDVMEVVDA